MDSLTWSDVLSGEKSKSYFINLLREIENQRKHGYTIYPPKKDVFNAFKYTLFDEVKIVILGQDPYHSFGQANGLAFSVNDKIKVPPSLVNIYNELSQDITNFKIPNHGNLKKWAEQGVLLLNNILTVKEKFPQSHQNLGWEIFTDAVIEKLNLHKSNLVFLLWGSLAQKKCSKINRNKHIVLEATHPSPLSAHRGFFGCRHFSKANDYLIKNGLNPIDWQI